MIGVISDDTAFHTAVRLILQSAGWNDFLTLPPDLEQIQRQIVPACSLVLDAHVTDAFGFRKGGLALIRRLRSAQEWHYVGPILLLAYEPAPCLGQWPDAEVLNTKGVKVLQIPFKVAEFQAALASTPPLSEADWDDISRCLGPKSVAELAKKLSHKYATPIGGVCSALGELVKFSHFLSPDFQEISEEIQAIRNRRVEERLNTFFADLQTLSVKAASLGLLDETCPFERIDSQISRIKQYLPLISLDKVMEKLNEVFQAAHECWPILENLLTVFTIVKEKGMRGKGAKDGKDGS